MKSRDYTVIALVLYALGALPSFSLVQADQLTMLTDFGLPKSSNPTRLLEVNGTLFFFVPTDSGYRSELWRSDGTAAGTVLVIQASVVRNFLKVPIRPEHQLAHWLQQRFGDWGEPG